MDYRELAAALLGEAKKHGADDADTLIAEGTEFSVSVRKGEMETLKEAGSKALGLRVFVGRRTANAHTSDFSAPGLREFVARCRRHGARDRRGRGGRAARRNRAGRGARPRPLRPRHHGAAHRGADRAGAPRRSGGARGLRASPIRTAARTAPARDTRCSPTPAVSWARTARRPVACRWCRSRSSDGVMERDYWYTYAHGPAGTLPPEEVGRIAAERTLRRLGARKVKTAQVPIVFDPETAAEILGTLFDALSGYAVFRNATFLRDQRRHAGRFASPDARRRGPAARAASARGRGTARGSPRAATCRSRTACCATTCATGTRRARRRAAPKGCARRGVGGGPGVGASQPVFRAGHELAAATDRRGCGARPLRHRPLRLRRQPGFRGLLAGCRGLLDREGRSSLSGERGDDRRQPQGDAAWTWTRWATTCCSAVPAPRPRCASRA